MDVQTDVQVGQWYLCEGYIDEPVRIEALEPGKVGVHYLSSGKFKWLGFPRIWLALNPRRIDGELTLDPQTRLVTLSSAGDKRQLGLGQLRAELFPGAPRRRQAPAQPVWTPPEPEVELDDEAVFADEADDEFED